jgi:hypothetical protein
MYPEGPAEAVGGYMERVRRQAGSRGGPAVRVDVALFNELRDCFRAHPESHPPQPLLQLPHVDLAIACRGA